MHQSASRWAACLVTALFVLAAGRASEEAPAAGEAFCQTVFGASSRLCPLALLETHMAVSEVSRDGQTRGWLFRTDQVPPVCKGKRGEIALLVALGTDGRIKGLQVLSHKEDPSYFKRLNAAFFQQFYNRLPGASKFDTVTRATLSSRAIIRDVTEGTRQVTALPEVAAKIKPDKDCSLTKTAALSHN
jgi:Na+-translocating ferredoxin:NAD+ oxidoreductase RnfG subunit